MLFLFGLCFLFINVRADGCVKDGIDRADGETWREGCVDNTCNDGHIDQQLKGCYFVKEDKCRLFGEVWGDSGYPCYKRGCRKIDDYTATEYFAEEGCQKSDGTCVKVGEQFDDNCSTYLCEKNGDKLSETVVKQGCQFKGDSVCFKDGETITRKCSTYRCDNGKAVMDVGKCSQGGECYAIDSTWTKGENRFTCTYNGTHLLITGMPTASKSITGCSHKGEEKAVGDKWKDGCFELECILSNDVYETKILSGGCDVDGKCVEDKYEWKENCSTFRCEKKSENQYSIVVVEVKCRVDVKGKVACQDNGWTGPYSECVTQTCVINGNTWKLEREIKCPAKDPDNNKICVPNGWTGKLPTKNCVTQRCVVDQDGYQLKYDMGCVWRENKEVECVADGEKRLRKCASFVCSIKEIDKNQHQSQMVLEEKTGCSVKKSYELLKETDSMADGCVAAGTLLKRNARKKCLVYECKETKKGFKLERNKYEKC